MLKNKKIVVLLLALVLLAQSTTVMAASFPDVNKTDRFAWAYDYIITLADKGIIKGYDDGTYKPGNNVNVLETLSLLYGVINPTNAEAEAALTKNKVFIDLLTDAVWGDKEMAMAIEKGVLTKTELTKYHEVGMLKPNTKNNISRYDVAVLMARALGLKEIPNYNFTYKDIAKLNKKAGKGYVAALLNIGILDPNGDGTGNFNPSDNITRAEMAKIVKLAYDWKAKNAADEKTKTENGLVVYVMNISDEYTLAYKVGTSDKATSVKVNTTTKITDKDGKAVALKDLEKYQNANVTITYTGEFPNAVAKEIKFTSDSLIKDGQFTIESSRKVSDKEIYVTLKDANGKTVEVRSLYDYAKDGNTEVKLSNLVKGTKVDVKFTVAIATEIKVASEKAGQYKVVAIGSDYINVKDVNYTGTSATTIKVNSNTRYEDNKGNRAQFSDIKEGMTLDITKTVLSNYADRIVIYTNGYTLNGKYTVNYITKNQIEVINNITNQKDTFEVVLPVSVDGLNYNSLWNVESNILGKKVDLTFNSSGKVTSIKTNDLDSKISVTASTFGDQIHVKQSYNYNYINRYDRVEFYIDGVKSTFDQAYVAIGSVYYRASSTKAVYVSSEIKALYIETTNYGGTVKATLISMYHTSRGANLEFKTELNTKPFEYTMSSSDPMFDRLSIWTNYDVTLNSTKTSILSVNSISR